jgi:hypothetical protein
MNDEAEKEEGVRGWIADVPSDAQIVSGEGHVWTHDVAGHRVERPWTDAARVSNTDPGVGNVPESLVRELRAKPFDEIEATFDRGTGDEKARYENAAQLSRPAKKQV